MILAQQQLVVSDLTEKIALALLGAVLGFIGAYMLDRVKAKREPRRRISWEVHVERALIRVSEDIKSRVKVLYRGREVAALTHIRCAFTNTGNRVVKDHELRFTFPSNAKLLEAYLDPIPDPELGLELIAEEDAGDRSEHRYRIAHLERGESVTIHFVTAGGDYRDWRPRSFNKQGDVEFDHRDAAIAKEDVEHVRPFLLIGLLTFLVPGIIDTVSLYLISDLTAFVTRVALFILLLPHVVPVSRVVNRLVVQQLGRGQGMMPEVKVWGGGSVVVVGESSSIKTLRIGTGEEDVALEEESDVESLSRDRDSESMAGA